MSALLRDNRTVLLNGEDIENCEEDQEKEREKAIERKKKEQAILA